MAIASGVNFSIPNRSLPSLFCSARHSFFLFISQHTVKMHFRDLIKDTPLVKESRKRYREEKEEEEKSPAPGRIQTHDLLQGVCYIAVLQPLPKFIKS